jgi:hypothetical protein
MVVEDVVIAIVDADLAGSSDRLEPDLGETPLARRPGKTREQIGVVPWSDGADALGRLEIPGGAR